MSLSSCAEQCVAVLAHAEEEFLMPKWVCAGTLCVGAAHALGALGQTLRQMKSCKTFCLAQVRALRSPHQVLMGPRRSDAVGLWEVLESNMRRSRRDRLLVC